MKTQEEIEKKDLCQNCKTQLKHLQKEKINGGRMCGICGFWRWDSNKEKFSLTA